MENNILQTLISDGVFSVAVAAYLLVRMEQKLADLTRAITELKTVIMQETRHNDAA
ncbi:YvrJ family protein [uncultured Cloacibacillus sp.]|uniref:YvrJ family protein n=1 Tax=uncultured Cloacibacillus sp. TaxID=889794 RepID=UPI0025D13182|nr:YvrJ family protein [uncultured Cloacibacillus sp.]